MLNKHFAIIQVSDEELRSRLESTAARISALEHETVDAELLRRAILVQSLAEINAYLLYRETEVKQWAQSQQQSS